MLPEVKTILYCTQMGPNAAHIFRYACVLAEKFDARIVVVHVMETLTPKQEALVEGYVGSGALHAVVEREEREAVTRLRKRIQTFCEREAGAADCSLRVDRIVVAEGHAVPEILRQVEETGADLVVVGAHARSAVLKAVLGSTAQKVIRGSPVPVLVVQVPEEERDDTLAGV